MSQLCALIFKTEPAVDSVLWRLWNHLTDGKKETDLTVFTAFCLSKGKRTVLYDVKISAAWNHVSQAF